MTSNRFIPSSLLTHGETQNFINLDSSDLRMIVTTEEPTASLSINPFLHESSPAGQATTAAAASSSSYTPVGASPHEYTDEVPSMSHTPTGRKPEVMVLSIERAPPPSRMEESEIDLHAGTNLKSDRVPSPQLRHYPHHHHPPPPPPPPSLDIETHKQEESANGDSKRQVLSQGKHVPKQLEMSTLTTKGEAEKSPSPISKDSVDNESDENNGLDSPSQQEEANSKDTDVAEPVNLVFELKYQTDGKAKTESKEEDIKLNRVPSLNSFNTNSWYLIWCTRTFFSFILAYILCVIFCLTCILYGIAQFYEPTLNNYWCDRKSLEDIRQNSITNNLNHGTTHGCWKSKAFRTNEDALFGNNGFASEFRSTNPRSIVFASLFFVCGAFLAYRVLYITIVFSLDLWKYLKGKLPHYEHQVTSSRQNVFLKRLDEQRSTPWTIREIQLKQKKQRKKRVSVRRSTVSASYMRTLCWGVPCIYCLLPDDVSQISPNCEKMAKYILIVTQYTKKSFGTDTRGWIAWETFKELVEICVQIFALLSYNGYNHRQVSQTPNFVVLYAAVIAGNCFSDCILWFCYLFWADIFHGELFRQISFVVDSIFDSFFFLFPLIMEAYHTDNVRKGLAQLAITDNIRFIANWGPLLLLVRRCNAVLLTSRIMLRVRMAIVHQYLKKYNAQKQVASFLGQMMPEPEEMGELVLHLNGNFTQYLPDNSKITIRKLDNFDNQAWIPSWACQSTPLALCQPKPSNQVIRRTTTRILDTKETRRRFFIRKIVIVFLALFYLIVGIMEIVFPLQHMDEASAVCNSGVTYRNVAENSTSSIPEKYRDILKLHPELYAWDKCLVKVYPFRHIVPGRNTYPEEIPCNCRLFRLDANSGAVEDRELVDFIANRHPNVSLDSNITDTSISILERILENWDMLQAFSFADRTNRITLNMQWENIYAAGTFMLVFDLARVTLVNSAIPSAISRWTNINYFRISNGFVRNIAEEFSHLNELKFLDLSNNELWTFPEQICDLTQLTGLNLEFCKFPVIPDCVADLHRLESFMASGGMTLRYFPMKLLSSPSLVELSLYWTAVSYLTFVPQHDSTPHTNHSWVPLLDLDLQWNDPTYTYYWFQDTLLCTSARDLYPQALLRFINETRCCEPVCSPGTAWNLLCKPYEFSDGVCDLECNSAACSFDGGDCNQLCDTELCLTDLKLNEECDSACNTSVCSFGFGKCIDENICNIKNVSHGGISEVIGCQGSWINDGWCDIVCRESENCRNDNEDCYGCGVSCEQSYQYFQRIANPWYSPDEHDIYALEMIIEDELCYYWEDFVSVSLLIDLGSNTNNMTCTDMFKFLDLNQNQVVGFYEFLVSIGLKFGLYNQTKALQLDCSLCMQHPEIYYS